MSRDVCCGRSRCRRLIGRTTFLAFTPFQPGLVLTYVMRNLSDTADREFNSTYGGDLGLTATSTGITETKLLGLTIPLVGTKKELGDHWRMVETEPKGYNCGN
jgi:hypothetical protein